MYNSNIKKTRTFSIPVDLDNKLKTVENASALISKLLEEYFDMKILEAKPEDSTEDLEAKAKELNLQLEQIEKKKEVVLSKDEVNDRLAKIGITNSFLIDRLRNSPKMPDIFTIRHLKEEYHINEALVIMEAWRLLHPESE